MAKPEEDEMPDFGENEFSEEVRELQILSERLSDQRMQISEENTAMQKRLEELRLQHENEKKMTQKLRFVQAASSLRVSNLQSHLDSSQSELVHRQFFLTGWVSRAKGRRSAAEILGPSIRQDTITKLKYLFQRQHEYPLHIVNVSHEYPFRSQCQRKQLSPKTLIELTNKCDVTKVHQLLRRNPLWTKDRTNRYTSVRVGFEGCIGNEERRKLQPLLMIVDCIKYSFYEEADPRNSNRKRSWAQAVTEFDRHFRLDMNELSIRRKQANIVEVMVKLDTQNVSPEVDCYISEQWIGVVKKFWDEAARYQFRNPYRSPEVLSYPHQDVQPPKKEAQVQPELELLATQMALTKQHNQQDWCKLERLSQTDAYGQQVVGRFRHPKYLYPIHIVPLADMDKKYRETEVRTNERSRKRRCAPVIHEHPKKPDNKRNQAKQPKS